MLWGDFKNAASHSISSSQAQKAFIESGIQLDKIYVTGISGIGLGVYYRYGAQTLENPKDNIAIKLTTSFSFWLGKALNDVVFGNDVVFTAV